VHGYRLHTTSRRPPTRHGLWPPIRLICLAAEEIYPKGYGQLSLRVCGASLAPVMNLTRIRYCWFSLVISASARPPAPLIF
jgi:hypothetical protein